MKTLWGIDLGGTKIECAVLDAGGGEPLFRDRIDTEAQQGYEHILSRVAELLESAKQHTGINPDRVGIAHPGVLDPKTKKLKNSNTQCLNGRTFQEDAEAACKVPLLLSNDANCFALAEACRGAARSAPVVFGVIMGTGVGGGIAVNGKAIYGAQGIAGEWGHNVLIPGGSPCYCGKAGCVEKYLSGPALEEEYFRLSGHREKLAVIAERARTAADNAAVETINLLTELFGRAIAVVINILDPDCIVLGGGVSNVDELYTRGREEAARWVFNDALHTRIVRNELGDSAGVIGAAMLTA